MKFVTLALAILLAVGCRAASLQADAPALPTYLEYARNGMRMTLDQVKAFADRIGENVKTEMNDEATGDLIKAKADTVYNYLIALQAQAAPVTDGIVGTIDEATRDLRNSIYGDIEALNEELKPKTKALRDTLEDHLNQYKNIVGTFKDTHNAELLEHLGTWKGRLEPVVDDLRGKLDVNVEDTKQKLMPIVDAIREKISARLENIRAMLAPYVAEYKEQLEKAYSQAQQVDVDALRERLNPHFEDLRASFEKIGAVLKEVAEQQ